MINKTIKDSLLVLDINGKPLDFSSKAQDDEIERKKKYFREELNIDEETFKLEKLIKYPELSSLHSYSLGYFKDGEHHTKSFYIHDYPDEIALIKSMFQNLSKIMKAIPDKKVFSGFAIQDEIIYYIYKRCIFLNIKVPKILVYYDKKPWELNTLDFQSVLNNSSNGWAKYNVANDITFEMLGARDFKRDIQHAIQYGMDRDRVKNLVEDYMMQIMSVVDKISVE